MNAAARVPSAGAGTQQRFSYAPTATGARGPLERPIEKLFQEFPPMHDLMMGSLERATRYPCLSRSEVRDPMTEFANVSVRRHGTEVR